MDSPKLQGHRRKSSYDGVLQANTQEALQAGFTEQPTYATIEKTTKLRKNKQKAPLPPQRPPSSVAVSRPPNVPSVPATRPPSVSAPKLPAVANNTKDTSGVETHQQIRNQEDETSALKDAEAKSKVINGSSENGKPETTTKLPAESTDNRTISSPKPIIKSEKPAIKTEKPAVKTDKPAVKAEKPTIKANKPVVISEKPAVK